MSAESFTAKSFVVSNSLNFMSINTLKWRCTYDSVYKNIFFTSKDKFLFYTLVALDDWIHSTWIGDTVQVFIIHQVFVSLYFFQAQVTSAEVLTRFKIGYVSFMFWI